MAMVATGCSGGDVYDGPDQNAATGSTSVYRR
jgi:hypothetical protein